MTTRDTCVSLCEWSGTIAGGRICETKTAGRQYCDFSTAEQRLNKGEIEKKAQKLIEKEKELSKK